MPRSSAFRYTLFCVATAVVGAASPVGAGAAEGKLLVPPTPKEKASAELIFLPDGASALDAPLRNGERRVLMTGAYSSKDRFAPGGFVLKAGDSSLVRLQGWDGLLLVDAKGRASLHHMEKVRHWGENWNLRERGQRRSFLKRAKRDGLSAVQSHLLIKEGVLDLRESQTIKRRLRRILFETKDGQIGVFESSPRMLTLYEAAQAVRKQLKPRFALNLDMGDYDFCETQSAEGSTRCGFLNRESIGKLTNVLAITLPSNQGRAQR